MKVTRGALSNPLFESFLDSGVEAGHTLSDDLNGACQEGVGAFDRTIYGGRRYSAARAYLDAIRQHPGLQIRTNARALRLVTAEGTPGVDVLEGGVRRTLHAEREVIVCAGAIGSPQILMLSGIGDADSLRARGITPVLHLPGVGENLQDHLEVYVQFAAREPVSLYPATRLWNKAWIGPLWYLAHRGPAATNHFEAGGFIRSGEDVAYPDLQLHFLPLAMNYDGSSQVKGHGFQVHVGPMKPTSRGRISLSSDDPLSAPRIEFNYATTEADRKVMRCGIRKVREIVAQRSFDRYRGGEISPGSTASSDDDLDRFASHHAESAYHPSGTCRMGKGEDAVVDAAGRVHGVSGIRVIDASIMPEITNGNLNAPVLMLAEKMVDALLGGPQSASDR